MQRLTGRDHKNVHH